MMAQGIKAFVDKLHAEGIQAGRQAGQEIRAKADRDAQDLIDKAQAEAGKIVEDARKEAALIHQRMECDLDLAVRDSVLRLRDTLTQALRRLLEKSIEPSLADSGFLRALLHDVVMQYVKADADGQATVFINVSDQMREQLLEWALQEFRKDFETEGIGINLRGSLKEAGFEYAIMDGTIEITVDSVAEVLCDLVGEQLRERLRRAVSE